MKTYRDTMTDQDKLDLADYLASLDAERDFLRENPYTPIFGQYAPSIGHYEPDLLFTDEEDPSGQPDDHYYLAAGQEPPTAAPKGRWYNSKEFNFFLFALALFLVVLIFYPVS